MYQYPQQLEMRGVKQKTEEQEKNRIAPVDSYDLLLRVELACPTPSNVMGQLTDACQ